MTWLQIRGLRQGVIVASQPEGPDRTDPSPRLVFHRYGDSYFLREIRMPGNLGLALPATRLERDAAEKIASKAAPEVVVVRDAAAVNWLARRLRSASGRDSL